MFKLKEDKIYRFHNPKNLADIKSTTMPESAMIVLNGHLEDYWEIEDSEISLEEKTNKKKAIIEVLKTYQQEFTKPLFINNKLLRLSDKIERELLLSKRKYKPDYNEK